MHLLHKAKTSYIKKQRKYVINHNSRGASHHMKSKQGEATELFYTEMKLTNLLYAICHLNISWLEIDDCVGVADFASLWVSRGVLWYPILLFRFYLDLFGYLKFGGFPFDFFVITNFGQVMLLNLAKPMLSHILPPSNNKWCGFV
jgi:hypothetical protein